jgi:curli biogenesis system outer membrane secretion channel CsgG
VRKIIIIFMAFFAWGCASINPTTLTHEAGDRDALDLPIQCQYLYQPDRHIIAVVEFVNNTTFQGGTAVTGRAASQAQIGRTPGGFGASSAQSIDMLYRNISPQLGEFAQSAVESTLVRVGGATVVSRSNMERILREQQFQMTLADPDTAVEFGRLAGAEYIVTGTVDNLRVFYIAPSEIPQTKGNLEGVLTMLTMTLLNTFTAGWYAEVEMTTNIIDISTGFIIDTSKVKATAHAGNAPMFNTELVIAAAKQAMGKAVDRMVPFMNSRFAVKGHVNELRGGKKVALISIGSEAGLKQGDRVTPYKTVLQRDFITGREECIIIPLGFHMTVLSGVTPNSAWAEVNTKNKAKLTNLKVGSLVIRTRTR